MSANSAARSDGRSAHRYRAEHGLAQNRVRPGLKILDWQERSASHCLSREAPKHNRSSRRLFTKAHRHRPRHRRPEKQGPARPAAHLGAVPGILWPWPCTRECCLYGPGRHPSVFRPIHCSAWSFHPRRWSAPGNPALLTVPMGIVEAFLSCAWFQTIGGHRTAAG